MKQNLTRPFEVINHPVAGKYYRKNFIASISTVAIFGIYFNFCRPSSPNHTAAISRAFILICLVGFRDNVVGRVWILQESFEVTLYCRSRICWAWAKIRAWRWRLKCASRN